MVIALLERRSGIGLRRALGATRRLIAVQFVAESLLLSLLGGVGGVALGAIATVAYATYQGLPAVVPPVAVADGLIAAFVVGGRGRPLSRHPSSSALADRGSADRLIVGLSAPSWTR